VSRTLGSSAADTRARILDVARGLFANKGYAGTSVRDIADALGMTKAALYYHFPGKADVLAALIEPALDELDAIGDRAGLGREVVMRDYVRLLAERASGMIQIVSDPSAKRDLGERLDGERRFRALESALAGGGDPLGVRCALGAANVGVLGTLRARARAGDPPHLSDDEVERVIRASLAAWEAAS
jgi:AcrR family transcriptional regulator